MKYFVKYVYGRFFKKDASEWLCDWVSEWGTDWEKDKTNPTGASSLKMNHQ